jgi:hypothetical protein
MTTPTIEPEKNEDLPAATDAGSAPEPTEEPTEEPKVWERPIVAPASRGFNLKWIIAGVVLIGVGGWFVYDGFYNWPKQQAEYEQATEDARQADLDGNIALRDEIIIRRDDEMKERSDNDILLNRLFGIVLPLAGLGLIAWTLYEARGEVKLDDQDVLHVPGHPPVPLTAITAIDDSRWERKGKSFVTYDTGGQTGTLKLDDFIRERPPLDAIHDLAVDAHKLNTETAT